VAGSDGDGTAIAWDVATGRQLFTFKDLQGKEWTQPLWELVLHVVNHGTHHRGQVSGFLRTLGKEPPQLDMSFYDRQKAAGK
jgi:uncharacterized damage-inducible protein DinB